MRWKKRSKPTKRPETEEFAEHPAAAEAGIIQQAAEPAQSNRLS